MTAEEMGFQIHPASADIVSIIVAFDSKTRTTEESIECVKVIENKTDGTQGYDYTIAVAKLQSVVIPVGPPVTPIKPIEPVKPEKIEPYEVYVIKNNEVIGTATANARQINDYKGEIKYYSEDEILLVTVVCDRLFDRFIVTENSDLPEIDGLKVYHRTIAQCISSFYGGKSIGTAVLWV